MANFQTRYYQEFREKMILRDVLALDRTILANKRTLLAHMRTFIGLVAGGIGMVKLVADQTVNIIGYAFMIASIPIFIAGIVEYCNRRRALSLIVKGAKTENRDIEQIG